MVKVERISLQQELKTAFRGYTFGEKVRQLWRMGWMEIPYIMAMIPFTLTGTGILIYCALNYEKGMWKRQKYREDYESQMTLKSSLSNIQVESMIRYYNESKV